MYSIMWVRYPGGVHGRQINVLKHTYVPVLLCYMHVNVPVSSCFLLFAQTLDITFQSLIGESFDNSDNPLAFCTPLIIYFEKGGGCLLFFICYCEMVLI